MKRLTKKHYLIILILVLLIFFTKKYISAAAWPVLKKQIRKKFPDVKHVSVKFLYKMFSKSNKFILIDVRPYKEFKVSTLKSALNITSADKISKFLDKHQKNRKVILFCSVGYRSSAIAEKLVNKGYENIYNLEGSIFQWVNSGYPVYQNDKKVNKVHPYDYYWGLLLKPQYRGKL